MGRKITIKQVLLQALSCQANQRERRQQGRGRPAAAKLLFTRKSLFTKERICFLRLLQRYSSELLFLVATYKTTKYAIPLFFVCVRTNVDYQVVAEFMTQYEDQQSISEALSILKSWNSLWKPKYFMVDFSTVEIGAIEEQFPEATAYICDFHRLQAWQVASIVLKQSLALVT